MNAVIAYVASYVVSAAWQVPVLCVAGALIALLVRWLGPAAQHRLWVTTLLLCVLVPALPAPQMHGAGVHVLMSQATTSTTTWSASGSADASLPPLWVPVWLMAAGVAVWLLTVLYGAAKLWRAYVATERLVQSAVMMPQDGTVAKVLDECRRVFPEGDVRVMVSETVAGPVTLRHGGMDVLMLPARMLEEVPAVDLAAAVAHECAHMQRRDFTCNLLLSVAVLPVRFHPLVEVLQRRIAATREMACDAAAASLQGTTYRQALLRLAQWMATTSSAKQPLAMGFAVGIFDSNSLEDRMNRLSVVPPRLPRAARAGLAGLAMVALGGSASALAMHGMRLLPYTASRPTVAEPVATPATGEMGKLVQPRLIYQVDPEYPTADRNREHGPATHESRIGLTVDREGVPQNVHVVASGGAGFDANAIKAVRQYRFQPAKRDGKPVAADLTIAVNFQIF